LWWLGNNNSLDLMKKRVIDLSAGDLNAAASEAWSAATKEAFSKGLSVTGSRDGRRFRYHPDGQVDDLGPVAPLPDQEDDDSIVIGTHKSVA
jgi:hypothetical protein